MLFTIHKLTILMASALCLTAIGCSNVHKGNSDRNVAVRLKWIHQAQFAGFYVAQRERFYRDSDLNVTINPGGVDFPAIQMVVGGDEQFGVTGADQILLARDKGIPVVAVAVIYKITPMVLFALRSKHITKPQDLIGKKVGVKFGGNEELTYRALLRKLGISSARIHEIPVKYDMSPLFTGAVDVWPGYAINEPIVAQEQGYGVDIMSPVDYGVNLYADTLFTTESMIRDKPEIVRKFVIQTLRGWQRAIDDPDEAVNCTLSYSDKLVRAHELAMMKASIPLIKPDQSPLGQMDIGSWSNIDDILLQSGAIHSRVKVETAFTNDFSHD